MSGRRSSRHSCETCAEAPAAPRGPGLLGCLQAVRRQLTRRCVASVAAVGALTVVLGGAGGPFLSRAESDGGVPSGIPVDANGIRLLRDKVSQEPMREAWADLERTVDSIPVGAEWSFLAHESVAATALVAAVSPTESRIGRARLLLRQASGQASWCQPGNEWRPISLYSGATAATVALATTWLAPYLPQDE